MTFRFPRHTLSALAAVALFSAFASGAVSATERELMDKLGIIHRVNPRQIMLQTTHDPLGVSEPKVSKGLATHPRSQRNTTTHYEFRWWQDYSGGR